MLCDSILDLIGHTPCVKLNHIDTKGAEIYVKLERFNPLGSSKDRAALYMIEEAEKRGDLVPGSTIIEPTSGNTGIGLALCCAVKGYRIIMTMPESMSLERRKMLSGYGAELVLTPKELGMQGAVDKAVQLSKQYENSFIPSQFDNPDNPKSHELTTAPEIWEDTRGKVDIFVASFGTGGTVSGVGRKLKEYCVCWTLSSKMSHLLSKQPYSIQTRIATVSKHDPWIFNKQSIFACFDPTQQKKLPGGFQHSK